MIPSSEKDFRYLTMEDVKMRIGASVVRLRGDPVYIKGPTGTGLQVMYQRLLDKREEGVIHSSDSDLDISSPILGNCFARGCNRYLARGTDKHQKQGLDLSHMLLYYADGQVSRGFDGELSELGNTIIGKFPSFEETLRTLENKGTKTMPWGRYLSLAVTKDPRVHRIRHLINDVGLYFSSDNLGLIFKQYHEERMIGRLKPFMEVRAC